MRESSASWNTAGSTSRVSLSTVIHNPTIYNSVMSCLSHLELVHLMKVCHIARDATEQYQKAAFNINTFLTPFFDAIAFRSLQAHTQTLIGGSFAYCFLERSCPGTSINLLVYPAHCEEVGRWLLHNGYYYDPFKVNESFNSRIARIMSGSQDISGLPMVRDVLFFHKALPHATSVNVFVAMTNPLEIVFEACTTCFFSVISWRRAYCLFPRATLHERRTLLLRTREGPFDLSRVPEIADHVQKRGLTIEDTLPQAKYSYSSSRSCFPLGTRSMVDSASLAIELDVAGITLQSAIYSNNTSSCLTDNVVHACSFRLCGHLAGRLWVKYAVISSPLLKYGCIMGESELPHLLTHALHVHSLNVPGVSLDEELVNLYHILLCHLASRERQVLRYLETL